MQVEYFSDYDSNIRTAAILIGVFSTIAILFTCYQFYSFMRRNPSDQYPNEEYSTAYTYKFIYYLLDNASNVLFWIIYLCTIILLFFYKDQTSALLLLPELGEDAASVNRFFQVTLWIAAVTKLVAVFLRIVEQSKVKIFFVDHERHNASSK